MVAAAGAGRRRGAGRGNSVVVAFDEPAEFFICMRGGASCPKPGTVAGMSVRTDQYI
jgi:hypothetical protein